MATRGEAPRELLDDLHVVLGHPRVQHLRFSGPLRVAALERIAPDWRERLPRTVADPSA